MQGCGQTTLGSYELDKSVEPALQRLARLIVFGKSRGSSSAGVHLFAEYGDDQIGPLGEVSIKRAHSHPGFLGDVPHGSIDTGSREYLHGGIEQRMQIAPRIGTRGFPVFRFSQK